ncbi:MAG TPA: MmgE/PrpD family protein [Kofleriaceae bacterium]|nr:MmgE/PrpD family protein [Kofleriaceae bacterium]
MNDELNRRRFFQLCGGAAPLVLPACVGPGAPTLSPAPPAPPAAHERAATPPNLTRTFVDRIWTWRATGAEVLARARLLLLDGFGVGSAGAPEPGPTILAQLARAEGATPLASVIHHGFSTGLVAAARVNGTSMHVLDFEAMWDPANHGVSTITPGLLALAEQREAETGAPQGPALLRALAKGLEAQGRLRLSSGEINVPEFSVHPPGAVGAIAAAIAASDFLGLDLAQATMAAGIASSRIGGGFANVGSMTKALHCGDAAANGLHAALMAARGFTANSDALGGTKGWGMTFFPRFDPAPLIAPLTAPRILEPGNAWKFFPAEYGLHFVIAAALDVHRAGGRAEQIESVVLRVPDIPYLERLPTSGLDGKFSWKYVAAVALIDGKVDKASFSDRRRFAADIDHFVHRISLDIDRTIPPRFDQMHAVVTARLVGGTKLERRCDAPLGHWRRPAPDSAVEAKARGLLEAELGGEATARVLGLLMGVPLERLAIRPIMEILRGPAPARR